MTSSSLLSRHQQQQCAMDDTQCQLLAHETPTQQNKSMMIRKHRQRLTSNASSTRTSSSSSSSSMSLAVLLVVLLLLQSSTTTVFVSAGRLLMDHNLFNHGGLVNVLIGYNHERGKMFVEQMANATHQGNGLKKVNAIQAHITKVELQAFIEDPDINYIEENVEVQLLGEAESYGIQAIQASQRVGKRLLPRPVRGASVSDTTSVSCNDPDVLKIGLVDSGVDTSHPDLACNAEGGSSDNSNCIGMSFGIGEGYNWYDPADGHGTGVAGIIGAMRNNGLGTTGIVDGRNVCWIVARVFQSTSVMARMDSILDGVEWAVAQGARVLNLSLGAKSGFSITEDAFYKMMYDQNVVIVAAAGNDGAEARFYPASYDSVISVGAVDADNNVASFSQYNDGVNLVAPGAGVLTTAPLDMNDKAFFVSVDGVDDFAASAEYFRRSGSAEGMTGTLIDCNTGDSTCSSIIRNAICLIAGSSKTTSPSAIGQKIINCQNDGGIAAIFINQDENIPLVGSISSEFTSTITIPVVGISSSDGTILQTHIGQTITMAHEDGYDYVYGTSFASPHVAGAAAAVIQACPLCTNTQVISCLESSALDLGDANRDDYYGNGLVQVDATYTCLLNEAKCCNDDGSGGSAADPTGQQPTPAPTSVSPIVPSCSGKYDVAWSCLKSELDSATANDCTLCINGEIPEETASCDKKNDQLCFAYQACDMCGSCHEKIFDYYTCSFMEEYSCTVADCPGATAEDPPAEEDPAPDPTVDCTPFLTAARSCLDTQDDWRFADSCKSCVNGNIPSAGASCNEAESRLCTAFDTCECGECLDEVQAYFTCNYREKEACRFDCDAFQSEVGASSLSYDQSSASQGLRSSNDETKITSTADISLPMTSGAYSSFAFASVALLITSLVTLLAIS